jgi:predicted enzyme related to lactoylglutathione lyase
MPTITSVGVLLASKDPERLAAWYRALGVPLGKEGYGSVGSADPAEGSMFAVMPAAGELPRAPSQPIAEEPYGQRAITLNFRVTDLAAIVAGLRARGEHVAGPKDAGYGVFAWTKDPDGNVVELWQAAPPE